uniref:Uncharacterized protein n=1 Tax=viral metagenome TaxID=1070528 RepID=A0A6C0BED7_9ZZZZ
MSTNKSLISGIKGIDCLTGINSMAVVHLYYSISSLGQDLNTKILRLTSVLKRLNKNINVTDMQLKRFIIETNINPVHNQNTNEEDLDSETITDEFKIFILEKLKSLEDRISSVENIDKKSFKKNESINNSSLLLFNKDEGEKTSTIW